MKLAKYVMKKIKRMAINMFRLFLGIAVQKFPSIFDFGSQIINWTACSMTPIFMNTCIFTSSEIALLYYYLFFVIAIYGCTPILHDWLRATSTNLFSVGKFVVLYSHVVSPGFSFNNGSYLATGAHFIKNVTEWLNLYLNSAYCYVLNFYK